VADVEGERLGEGHTEGYCAAFWDCQLRDFIPLREKLLRHAAFILAFGSVKERGYVEVMKGRG
jgi:hypothetical protein